MTAPNRSHGKTREQRAAMCTGKMRWADELAATAGAVHAIEHHQNTDRLWIYRCPECLGWHLTSKPQNKPPITRDFIKEGPQ